MSMTFKITIPHGELFDHLEGREGRARNYELYRLAMNGLMGVSSNDSESKSSQQLQTSLYKKAIVDEPATQPKVETIKSEIKSEEEPTSSVTVDFGSDLITLQ